MRPGGLESRRELVGALPALLRVLGQRAEHHLLERGVQVGPQLRRRRGWLRQVLQRHGDRAVALEGQAPREHLEEHHADRIEVRRGGDRVALRLLGREVLRGAHDRAGLRHLRGAAAGDAEVRDLRVAVVVHDHVVRLEVAVDDPALVGEAGGAQDLNPEVDRLLLRQWRLGREDVLERAALQVLHRDVVGALVLAAVEDRDHVRVLQAGRRRRLAPEALHELLVLGEAAMQDLQGHLAAEVRVLGAVDVGHAAGADPVLDPVAAVDQCVVGYFGHLIRRRRAVAGALPRRSGRPRYRPGPGCARWSRRSPPWGLPPGRSR